MWIVIASNSYHEIQAFGPYEDEDHANDDINNAFEPKHPGLDWLAIEVDEDYASALR